MTGHELIELRSAPADATPDGEVTLYVKGFLSRGEEADHFDAWLASHDTLVGSHAWGSRAVACSWPSGELLPRPLAALGALKGAVDVARIVHNVRRAARVAHWGALVAEELALVASHFAYQYVAATRNAAERAEDLAHHLARLAARHERVRVVAHSLGCRHVIEGVALLASGQRPSEIHLCAPACRERDVADKLDALALGSTWLYHTNKDRVLDLAFKPIARGRALGAVGAEERYTRLVTVDVSEHFDFFVHNEYARRLAQLVPRDRA